MSTITPCIDGKTVGKHDLICIFMKGIFHLRPALPRYNVTWDVSQVSKYLDSLPSTDKIFLKALTFRVVMLISLKIVRTKNSIVTFYRHSKY